MRGGGVEGGGMEGPGDKWDTEEDTRGRDDRRQSAESCCWSTVYCLCTRTCICTTTSTQSLPNRSTTSRCLYLVASSLGVSSSGVRGLRGALSWMRAMHTSTWPRKAASCRATQPVVAFLSCTSAPPFSTRSRTAST